MICVSGKGLHGLNKLKVLRLDFNRINQISPSELGVCSQLVSLDLSSNHISSIAVSIFHWSESLVDKFYGCFQVF